MNSANKKSRSDLAVKPGQIGDGSSPLSLSRADIWRTLAASFPTPFSTASGVVGLIAGPSSAFRSLNFERGLLARFGWRLQSPACEPGKHTFVISCPRLYHLAPGRLSLLAARWPGATGLTSYLSGCISLTCQRCFFNIADVLEV